MSRRCVALNAIALALALAIALALAVEDKWGEDGRMVVESALSECGPLKSLGGTPVKNLSYLIAPPQAKTDLSDQLRDSQMSVDYETIQKIQKLGDDVLIGVAEVAALTGFSVLTVRQRKLPGLEPVQGLSRLRWRLGDLRTWMRTGDTSIRPRPPREVLPSNQKGRGRPTKKAQVEARQ